MSDWNPLDISDVSIGDYIRCETFTHSQKWLIPGYEEYNCVTEGRVILMQYPPSNPTDIMIEFEGQVQRLGPDPGTSGGWILWRGHAAP